MINLYLVLNSEEYEVYDFLKKKKKNTISNNINNINLKYWFFFLVIKEMFKSLSLSLFLCHTHTLNTHTFFKGQWQSHQSDSAPSFFSHRESGLRVISDDWQFFNFLLSIEHCKVVKLCIFAQNDLSSIYKNFEVFGSCTLRNIRQFMFTFLLLFQ